MKNENAFFKNQTLLRLMGEPFQVLTEDLFFQSKFAATVKHIDNTVIFVSKENQRPDKALIVDLQHQDALEVLKNRKNWTYCFSEHLQTERMAEAKKLGAKVVLSRGAFFNQLGEILKEIQR